MNIAMTERKPAAAQSLKDKVSLITGSTSGIGLGIARALARAGSAIVLNGFGKPEEIEAVRDGVAKEFGVHVAYSGADMSNPASIDRYRCPTVAKSWPRGTMSRSFSAGAAAPIAARPSASARSIPSGRSRNMKWRSACSPNGSSASRTPAG